MQPRYPRFPLVVAAFTLFFSSIQECPLERYDEQNNYCRMLGHYIPFKYCRTQQNGMPCAKILDCHFERIPIQEFINKHYSEAEQTTIFKQQPPKMTSILQLVAQAKARQN